MNASCLIYEFGMFQVWMSHVSHTQWYSAHKWVMSHTWLSHVSRMSDSCLTCEWVVSHIWVSLFSHMAESCVTHTMQPWSVPITESCLIHEWVMSYTWVSHVSRMNESCLTYEWNMSHIWMHTDNDTLAALIGASGHADAVLMMTVINRSLVPSFQRIQGPFERI